MAEDRNPFPQPNKVRGYTQRELKRRKIGALAIPNPTSMPFVRFTSTKSDPGEGSPKSYRFFHMGLHGLELEKNSDEFHKFGNIFEMSYGGQDVVGYAFDKDSLGNPIRVPITSTDSKLTKDLFPEATINTANPRERQPAEGRHPIPGVTNVSVRHMGVNEPIQVTVGWICYNQTQLEFLRQHFLMAGGYVIIEFGHYWSNREQPQVFDFGKHEEALNDLTDFVIKGRRHMSDNLFERAHGNYNMVIGRVVDQSISFQADGTIHCSTTFYSTGEAVFGVHNTRLLTGVSTEAGRKRFSVTINEFFSDNGGLDLLLDEPQIKERVVELKAEGSAEIRRIQGADATEAQLEALQSRYDSKFIPWSMFIRDVMEALFARVGAKNVSADARLFTEINKTEPTVGNHPKLASTDPDTLVIVKPFMLQGGLASEEDISSGRVDSSHKFVVRRAGETDIQTLFKDASGGEEKGLLSNGVWLNVGAIKDSFTQSSTFYQGFMALLTRMNNATENYWHLDLAFDEEEQQYKIYDKKCIFDDGEKFPPPYLFNEGNRGELLELSFEANFSKEAKTAILLASEPKTREEAIEDMEIDGYNQPSVWTAVMNLPDLKDELKEGVHARRTTEASARREEIDPGAEEELRRSRAQDRKEDREQAKVDAEDRAAQEQQRRATRIARFGDPIGPYIGTPSVMIAAIAEDGRRNPKTVNNYVSPIPTEINMSMTMQGITGLSFYDTFLVDKLPRIYEDHGVFLINEIQHSITPSGWTTTIGGLFFFVNLTGEGQASDIPVESNVKILSDAETLRENAIGAGTGRGIPLSPIVEPVDQVSETAQDILRSGVNLG